VVKRILKEKTMYEKEVVQIENRLEKMKAEGRDEYEVRKMVKRFRAVFMYLPFRQFIVMFELFKNEVLEESKMMVPETLKRLENSYQDLKSKLDDLDDDSIKTTADYKEAIAQLEECQRYLEAE